ncbi:MAG: hypothetical protein EHM93_01965 [Bacteroidales bacterium]|nr:MAG: hypothetical protein EHM93_01965 [Bacteroidales bacterium]
MKRAFLTLLFLLFLLVNSLLAQVEPTFTDLDAATLLSQYSEALSKNDASKIRKFWAENIGQDFFASLPISSIQSVDISNKHDLSVLINSKYIFDKVVKKEGYYELYSYWMSNSSSMENLTQADSSNRMVHYIVNQKSGWVLEDPVNVFTSDWSIYETEFIRFHYPTHLDISRYSNEMIHANEATRKFLKLFGVKLDRKIEYYKALSGQECGMLGSSIYPKDAHCLRPSHPEINPVFDKIVSLSFCNPHEILHGITALAGIPDVNTVFLEGLPVALAGTTWLSAIYSRVEAWKIVNADKAPELSTFFSDEGFLGNTRIAYHLCGSFIDFVLKQHGLKSLLDFYKEYRQINNLDKAFIKIYGVDFSGMESKWINYLKSSPIPIQIDYKLNNEASIIFDMSDPLNDDVGNGSYKYPQNDGFKSGVCDITRFRMYEDSQKLYFQVDFRETMEPVFCAESEEWITPAIYIGLNRGIRNIDQTDKNFAGASIQPDKGIDMIITAGFGVAIENNNRKRDYISEKTVKSLFDYSKNQLVFSIDKNFIGSPNSEWYFFVGCGLQSDYGVEATNGYPLSIESKESCTNGWDDSGDPYNPDFFDLLLPSEIQKEVFSNYSFVEKRRAVIKMIGLSRDR